MARALRHLQQERGHRLPAHVMATAGRRRQAGEEGARAVAGLDGSGESGGGGGGQPPAQKRARLTPTDGLGLGGGVVGAVVYPRIPSASGALKLLDGSGGSSSGASVPQGQGQGQQLLMAVPGAKQQQQQQDAASLTEQASDGSAGSPTEAAAARGPVVAKEEEGGSLEEEEEEEDVGLAAKEFREAWATLLGQAVVAGAWPGEGQEPLAVRAVEGAVAPLLARAEAGDKGEDGGKEGVEALTSRVGDLEWAHKVVAAGMGALSDRVRGAVERRWAEVEGLQAECWAVVAVTPLARDPALVAMVAARRPGWEAAAVEGLLALAGRGKGQAGGMEAEADEEDGGSEKEEAKDGGSGAAAASPEAEANGDGDPGAGEAGASANPPAAADAAAAASAAPAEAASAPATTTSSSPTTPDDPAAPAAAERLKPLARKLANARSLLEAGRAQAEDAAKGAWAKWGRLRRGLLAAARRRCPGLGGATGGGRTLLLYDARCAHHKVPEAHVEQPGRFLEASGAMRALARDHPGRFVLRTQIGGAYFPRAFFC